MSTNNESTHPMLKERILNAYIEQLDFEDLPDWFKPQGDEVDDWELAMNAWTDGLKFVDVPVNFVKMYLESRK